MNFPFFVEFGIRRFFILCYANLDLNNNSVERKRKLKFNNLNLDIVIENINKWNMDNHKAHHPKFYDWYN